MAFSKEVLKKLNTMTGDYHPVVSYEKPLIEKAIEGAKLADTKTIGAIPFDGGIDATQVIKSIDPQNLAGAIPFGLDLIEMVKNLGAPETLLQNMIGGKLFSLIQNISQGIRAGEDMLHEMKHAGDIMAKENKKKKKPKKEKSDAKAKAKKDIDAINQGGVA